jgi:hypothetical protein
MHPLRKMVRRRYGTEVYEDQWTRPFWRPIPDLRRLGFDRVENTNTINVDNRVGFVRPHPVLENLKSAPGALRHHFLTATTRATRQTAFPAVRSGEVGEDRHDHQHSMWWWALRGATPRPKPPKEDFA